MAGWEFAMQSRARVGLLIFGLGIAPLAFAHGTGVTHSYENGQPVITVRLVPDEASVANAKRIDALDPSVAHTAPSEDLGGPVEAPEGEAAGGVSADEFAAPETPDAAAQNGAGGDTAAVSRYPSARPALKPDTETGVGGALDLSPPAVDQDSQPRPMRLNSVDRPRRVVERTPARQRSEPRQRAQRVRTETADPAPDPLDAALPSVVVDAPHAEVQSAPLPAPVNMMQLPPPKIEERIAGGN
jgi:hypothetical protein